MKVLTDFLPIEHGEENSQAALYDWFVECMVTTNRNNTQIEAATIRKIIERFYIKSEIINKRRTAGGNIILDHDWVGDPKGPSLSARTAVFAEYANICVNMAYENAQAPNAQAPDGIVHVTCSGYLLPSAIQNLVSKKNWNDVSLVHAYHMGCHGAFPGIKIASGLSNFSNKKNHRVDVIHTEMFSPFYDPERLDPSSIIAFSLFADGAIKYSVVGVDSDEYEVGLEILSTHEEIIPDSLQDMTWGIGDRTFLAFLSPKIPGKIGQAIAPFVERLCKKGGIDFQAQKNELEYAIHPGGTTILRAVSQNLGISDTQLTRSFDLLREKGNMSSVSVPYLLKDIIENPDIKDGTKVLAVGFGPGLTATGFLLRKISRKNLSKEIR